MTPTIVLLIIIAACLMNAEERAESERRHKEYEEEREWNSRMIDEKWADFGRKCAEYCRENGIDTSPQMWTLDEYHDYCRKHGIQPER